ncbi:MAG: hypothetical protein HS130_11845 [Deltaproteobacteria bacterium]|nr:hypothetical protein [Deltaproteobacteria bacterium]
MTEARVRLASSRERLEAQKRELAEKERAISDTALKIQSRQADIEKGPR